MALYNIKTQLSSYTPKATWDTGNSIDDASINIRDTSIVNSKPTILSSRGVHVLNSAFWSGNTTIGFNTQSSLFKQNNDSILMRSQLLSKNMREGNFNFYYNKFDPLSISYTTTYFYLSQNISSISFYKNFKSQNTELAHLLSLPDVLSENLTNQFGFVVSAEYFGQNKTEALNNIANEYAANYNGKIINILPELNIFIINFANKQLSQQALLAAQSDSRLTHTLRDGYANIANWDGKYKSPEPCRPFHYLFDCFAEEETAHAGIIPDVSNIPNNEWPSYLCPVTYDSDSGKFTKRTFEEIRAELPACYGRPNFAPTDVRLWLDSSFVKRLSIINPNIKGFGFKTPVYELKNSFVYHHLDRLDDMSLPLDRGYSGRTKPRNILGNTEDGHCSKLKEPVYVYVIDQPIALELKQHPEFENRLNTLYGPYLLERAVTRMQHGLGVASVIAGRNCGVTRKPEIVSVGVLTPKGASFSTIAIGIVRVIKDKQENPDRKIVMNLSLGGLVGIGAPLNIMEYAINLAIQEGVVVVAAAGNDGLDAEQISPARMENVITVGSSYIRQQCIVFPYVYYLNHDKYNYVDTVSAFSNRGPKVDIYSSGENITMARHGQRSRSTRRVRMFESSRSITNDRNSGTSFAAPLAAGVAAEMLRKLFDNKTPNDNTQEIVKNLLIGYATGGDGGIQGKWNGEPAYGIWGLTPGVDNNFLLQNPFGQCSGQETINDLNDPEDCENLDEQAELIIDVQPRIDINDSSKLFTSAKVIHPSHGIYLEIADLGVAWQRRENTSAEFETFAYGKIIDKNNVPDNTTEIRCLFSFPGITGNNWHSTETSLISETILVNIDDPTPS